MSGKIDEKQQDGGGITDIMQKIVSSLQYLEQAVLQSIRILDTLGIVDFHSPLSFEIFTKNLISQRLDEIITQDRFSREQVEEILLSTLIQSGTVACDLEWLALHISSAIHWARASKIKHRDSKALEVYSLIADCTIRGISIIMQLPVFLYYLTRRENTSLRKLTEEFITNCFIFLARYPLLEVAVGGEKKQEGIHADGKGNIILSEFGSEDYALLDDEGN